MQNNVKQRLADLIESTINEEVEQAKSQTAKDVLSWLQPVIPMNWYYDAVKTFGVDFSDESQVPPKEQDTKTYWMVVDTKDHTLSGINIESKNVADKLLAALRAFWPEGYANSEVQFQKNFIEQG